MEIEPITISPNQANQRGSTKEEKVASDSIQRMRRINEEASKSPSLVNNVLRGIAIVAAVGTILNLSMDLVETLNHKN